MKPTTLKEIVVLADANSYDWVSRFWDSSSLSGPDNTVLIMGGRRDGLTYPENHPDYLLNKGLGGIHLHLDNPTNNNIPFDRRGNFSGRNFFLDALGGKQFSQYNSNLNDPNNDVIRAKNAFFSRSLAKYNSFDTKEVYDGTGWYYQQNIDAFVKIWKAIGTEAVSRGMIVGMDYGEVASCWDGAMIGNLLNDQKLYDGLQSPSAAMNMCKTILGDPFLVHQLYNSGCHKTVNHYWRGSNDPHMRYFEMFSQSGLARMVRQASGVDYKLIAYFQNVVNEFTDFNVITKKPVDGGGEWISLHAPGILPGACLSQYVWAAQDHDIVWDFTDPQLRGTSTHTLETEYIRPDGSKPERFDSKGTNNNPDHTSYRLHWDMPRDDRFGKNGGPYPTYPHGFIDLAPIGFNVAGELYRHVGTKDWFYPSIYCNGTNYTPGPGHSFAKTMRDNKLPYIRGYRNPQTGSGWVSWDYRGGKAPLDAVLNVGGVEITVKMLPGEPQWFLFTSPA